MGDVAAELARRGHRTIVFTAANGYDDPSITYPLLQVIDGVEVRRLRYSSFGKQRMSLRMLAALLFSLQCAWACLWIPRPLGILYSTSPPFIGAFAGAIGWVRRIPTAYWIMDLVPDLLIASGRLRATSLLGHILERLTRFSLRTAKVVVALDPYMQERVLARGDYADKTTIIPPWSPDVILETGEGTNLYRARHGIRDETIVMYSGNHSPMNPLDTVLRAAERLRDEPGIRFFFVGGGAARPDVERFVRERALTNVVLASSEPVERLGDLLAAADVHVVTLGDAMAGIIHPCKVYGAMAAGRPILYVGPQRSHVGDLLSRHPIGWHCPHGDVEGATNAILQAHRSGRATLAQQGQHARHVVRTGWHPALLRDRVATTAERIFLA